MDFTYIAIVLVVILFSMTIHEAMHAFASYWLGDDTAKLEGRLTLNPIPHIDPFLTILLPLILAFTGAPIFGGAKPVPFNPARVRYGEFGAAIVGVAGPLVNLFLAFVAYGIFVVAGGSNIFLVQAELFERFLQTAVFVNLGFFIFNMLPVPPLDGSRVLYALAPDPVRAVMQQIERYGIFLIFAIVLLLSPLLSQFIIGSMNFIIGIFDLIFIT